MLEKYILRAAAETTVTPPTTTTPTEAELAAKKAEEEAAKKKAEEDAAAAKKQAEEEEAAKNDPLLRAIIGDMRRGLPKPDAAPDAAEAAKKAEAEAAAKKLADEAAAKKKAAEEEEEKKKQAQRTVRKGVIEVEAEIVPPLPTAPAAPAPITPQPQLSAEEQYIASLTDDQREELREAEVAERLFPDKHKGRKAALVGWFKKYDEEVTKLVTKDAERTLDENDPEFRALVRSKPVMSQAENKRVLRTIGADEATAQMEKKIAPELTNLKVKQAEIDAMPRALKTVASLRKAVVDVLIEAGGPVAEALKHPEDESLALERAVHDREMELTDKLVIEYMLFAHEARQYNPKNELHTHLLSFITDQERQMLALNDPKVLNKEGRRFVTRHQMYELRQKEGDTALGKYWQFDHHDVLKMLAAEAAARVQDEVNRELERAKKLGLTKVPKSAAPPAEPPPDKVEEEKPKTLPTRTAATTTATTPAAPPAAAETKELVSTLGLRRT